MYGYERSPRSASSELVSAADSLMGQTVEFAPTYAGFSVGTRTMAANTMFITRHYCRKTRSISALRFVVTTAASLDDAVDVGIFDAAGTRLVSSGATTGKLNVTGIQTISITPAALTAGAVYYVALSCGTIGGTGATVYGAVNGASSGVAHQVMGTTLPNVEMASQSSAHPLPASVGAIGAGISSSAALWLVNA